MQGYTVGTRLRYQLTLATGMLECLCFAGVVFGYASLVFVLKEDGYFSHLCDTVPGTNGTPSSTGEHLGYLDVRGDNAVGMLIQADFHFCLQIKLECISHVILYVSFQCTEIIT